MSEPPRLNDEAGVSPARTGAPVFPRAAAAIAVGGFFASGLAATVVGVVTAVLGVPALGRLIIGQLVLWGGLVGTCALVSRRYGTGDVVTDFGWRMQAPDVVRGLLISWIARIVAVVIVLPFVLAKQRVGSNTRLFERFDTGAGLVVVAVIAIVGAPIVEELFFRGLVQRTFESRLGPARGVAVQAGLFAVAHVNPLLGVANLSLVLALAGVGATFGVAARRYGRLGPTMAAHGWFNAAAVLGALAAQGR